MTPRKLSLDWKMQIAAKKSVFIGKPLYRAMSLLVVLLLAAPNCHGATLEQKKKGQEKQKVKMTIELTVRLERGPEGLSPAWVQDAEVDSRGNVLLLDSKMCRILKYDQNGRFLLSFGKTGTGKSEFIRPDDIIIDSRDCVYVLDGPQKRVCKFSSAGVHLSDFGVDLKYSGLRLKGTLGPVDRIILAGYKNGRVFYVYDPQGKPLTSFGSTMQPTNPPPSNWRLESTYIAETLFISGGILYCTHPFRYELVRYDIATSKALQPIPLKFKGWRDAELRDGGIIIHTAVAKTVVDREGRIYNLVCNFNPGYRSEYYLDIADKDGKKLGAEHQVKYCAMAIDENDRFYLISNEPEWTLTRVKFRFH